MAVVRGAEQASPSPIPTRSCGPTRRSARLALVQVRARPHEFVLNGIAYHEPTNRMYVTGKKWDQMYRIKLKAEPERRPEEIESLCNLG